MTDKESKFDQIAKQIAEQKNYSLVPGCYNYRLCPDQYMGKVQNKKWKRKNIFDENGDVILEEIPYGEGAMIVVLESPHIEEYDVNGPPNGPACGATGENLHKMTDLTIFQEYAKYQLYIINAIPFQCSLGDRKMTCRDRVFTAVWNKNETGKGYFAKRLNNLIKTLLEKDNTIVLINACTVGNNRKRNVQKVIKSLHVYEKIMSFQIEHPANWNIPELIEA